jgi:RHS repeat-associated protein
MQGQYDDGDTGLYYNTFRYYDADSGRFSAEDPIGLAGGDNLYQYTLNPLTWTDPLGLLTVYIGAGAAAFTVDPKKVFINEPSELTGSATASADVIVYSPESGWFAADSVTYGADTEGADLGCGAGFGPELGFFTGNLAGFEGTTHNTVITLLLITISYGENDAGDWGLGISTGKGGGLGMYKYDSETKVANWKEILK